MLRYFFIFLFGSLQQLPASQPNLFTTAPVPVQSWAFYLQHLPEINAPIVDYRGNKIAYQDKHVAVLPFDVGTSDLQQCADALMRLRAEYLFGINASGQIGFHFTNDVYYSFNNYCKGYRPVREGSRLAATASPCLPSHAALRHYLDIVYAYAGTLSLEKELKPAADFAIGTIVIHAGSPGHCFIIIDEKKEKNGDRLFKLAEGYTPAQSIYVLSNPFEPDISPWYCLKKGVIRTASYTFTDYKLKTF